MKKIISFGKIAYANTRKENEVTIEIELRDKNGLKELSICGNVWNRLHTDIICGGQCLDEIAKYIHTPEFKFWFKMWKNYHLNGMHPGTPRQEAYLKEIRKSEEYKNAKIEGLRDWDTYGKDCYFLERAGLLEDEKLPRYFVQYMDKSGRTVWRCYRSQEEAREAQEQTPDFTEIGFKFNGYIYGTEWLNEEIPADDLAEIEKRITE